MADAPSRQVVLIVEDEALVRMTAVDMIEEAGFEVLEATNADEAILLLEARRDITVVFTDIEMPGSMDGLSLARAVRGRWPPIKIIAASGRYVVRDGDLPRSSILLASALSDAAPTRDFVSEMLLGQSGRYFVDNQRFISAAMRSRPASSNASLRPSALVLCD